MIEFLEIAGSIVGYVVIGLTWARSQAVRLQKLINKAEREYDQWVEKRGRAPRFSSEGKAAHENCPWWARSTWEKDLRVGLGLHSGLWPAFMLSRLASKLNDWTSAPVKQEREAAEKLREEAENIRNVADATEAPQEKNLLLDLAKDLLRQALDRDV